MDTSETYIKMCKKAEEIQALSHYPFGEVRTGDDWVWRFESTTDMPNQWQQGENGEVWLPRQDQLQEMIGNFEIALDYIWGIGSNLDEQPCLFEKPFTPEYIESFTSMEQLWLAFVMKEKYNKTWDKENWIKAEQNKRG